MVRLAVAACAASSKLILFIAAPAEDSILGCQCKNVLRPGNNLDDILETRNQNWGPLLFLIFRRKPNYAIGALRSLVKGRQTKGPRQRDAADG